MFVFLISILFTYQILIFLVFSCFENGWQFINLFVAVSVLIATAAAVVAAIYSFKVSRSALYYNILSTYSSSELGIALDMMWDLSKIKDKNIDSFNTIVKKYEEKKNNLGVEDSYIDKGGGKVLFLAFDYSYKEANNARRLVSHFYQSAFEMYDEFKSLQHKFFKKICSVESFELLYRVIEWLEYAENSKYNPKTFTRILEKSGRTSDNIKKLNKYRPPEARK